TPSARCVAGCSSVWNARARITARGSARRAAASRASASRRSGTAASRRGTASAERYALMWSGGKDSALALLRSRARGLNVARLVNFYDPASERVRFHATRRELIAAQAGAIGIELRQYAVPWERYETIFGEMLDRLR